MFLRELQQQLKQRHFMPVPVRERLIPKTDGRKRPRPDGARATADRQAKHAGTPQGGILSPLLANIARRPWLSILLTPDRSRWVP